MSDGEDVQDSGLDPEKFFCPRLIDYIAVVGSSVPLSKRIASSNSEEYNYLNENDEMVIPGSLKRSSSISSNLIPAACRAAHRADSIYKPYTSGVTYNAVSRIQTPQLLRRYPEHDHEDFALPKDVVYFCQPEGCITTTGRLSDHHKASTFVFTVSDKDTVRTRYGICLNFYRPVKQMLRRTRSRATDNSADYSTDTSSEQIPDSKDKYPFGMRSLTKKRSVERSLSQKSQRPWLKHSVSQGSFKRPRNKIRYNTLTSVCLISHHPFFMGFRECLFYLKSLVDICGETYSKGSERTKRRGNVWDIIIEKSFADSSVICHYVREIERWILRLLSTPVPVPGKTRVEVELFAPRERRPPLIFALPDHTRLSLLDFPIHLPLELLGVDTCIEVLTLILLEMKVVFQSRDYNALSMSVMSFIALLYPLDYMFPVIPLLPISLDYSECLLENPTPYVVGVPVNFFSLKKHFKLPDDIWLVDLDANKITPPANAKPILPLPSPDGDILKNNLRQAVSRLSGRIASSNSKKSKKRFGGKRNNEKDIDSVFTKNKADLLRDDSFTNSLFEYGNDVDAVDVAVRIAMVRFFNSESALANLAEHTRTLRLFPKPVVTLQANAFLHSHGNVSPFLEQLCRTQAVEYLAEWQLTPSNVVFQRIHTGVYDPAFIGDKCKWFAYTLEPIVFRVWNPYSSLENILGELDSADEVDNTDDSRLASSDESRSESDQSEDISSTEPEPEPDMRRQPNVRCSPEGEELESAYNPPLTLQIPKRLAVEESSVSGVSSSSASSSSSDDRDLTSPEFQPSSLSPPVIREKTKKKKSRPGRRTESITSALLSFSRQSSRLSSDDTPKSGAIDTPKKKSTSSEFSFDFRSDSIFSSRKDSQDGLLAQMDRLKVHAKKAADGASKSVQDVSRNALEASKVAADVSKSTLEDLSYVSKSTFSDLTKGAKEVASKTSFLRAAFNTKNIKKQIPTSLKLNLENNFKIGNPFGLDSGLGEENPDLTTSHQFNKQSSQKEKTLAGDSPLIRHTTPRRPMENMSQSKIKERSITSADNQAFLRDLAHQILEEESIGWLKINRCKKLLEDESNRALILSKLNRTLDCKINPLDHVEDVYIPKVTYKSMLKLLQVAIRGFEVSVASNTVGSISSIFHLLEIAHTHYWSIERDDESTSGFNSQITSPTGSTKNLSSSYFNVDSPNSASRKSSAASESFSRKSSFNECARSLLDYPSAMRHESHSPIAEITKVPASSWKYSSSFGGDSEIPTEPSTECDEGNKLKQYLNRKTLTFMKKISSVDAELFAADNAQPSSSSSDVHSLTESLNFVHSRYAAKRFHRNNASFRSTVSDSEVDQTNLSKYSRHMPSTWSCKSSVSSGYRFHGGVIHNTLGHVAPESSHTYLFEGLIGKDRSYLWDDLQFWEDAFIDAISLERDVAGMDQGTNEVIDKYKRTNDCERKRLAHDEDKLLSTMLYNMTAFMIMMRVKKESINSKIRSILGKCRISISYAEDIITLLQQLSKLRGNDVDLKCVPSRLGHGQSFAAHVGSDNSGELLFVEVRDDGLVMRTIDGILRERWWYERIINMTYSPKNKVICLWKKVGGQTALRKYHSKKSKQLYHCIKSAMERAVSKGQNFGEIANLGGEFPVKDLETDEGGLLQVCMEGIGLLFSDRKLFVKLKFIANCFALRGKYFMIQEYRPRTKSFVRRWYESTLSGQICYSVLCVISYAAAIEKSIPMQSDEADEKSEK